MSVMIDNIKTSSYVVGDIKVHSYCTKDDDIIVCIKIVPRDGSNPIQLSFSKDDWVDIAALVYDKLATVAMGG